LSTVSRAPPWSVAITGLPIAPASGGTRPERFRLGRGRHHDVGHAIRRRHVLDMVFDGGDTMQLVVGNGVLQLFAIEVALLRIAADDDPHAMWQPVLSLQQPDRVQQHKLPFPAAQPARQQHQTLVVVHAPSSAQRRHPGRIDLGRIEMVEIDAARDRH
jgi:hypothetical protein